MKLISVFIYEPFKEECEQLLQHIKQLQQETLHTHKMKLHWETEQIDHQQLHVTFYANDQHHVEPLLDIVLAGLAKHIVAFYERNFMLKLIKKKLHYLYEQTIQNVCDFCWDIMYENDCSGTNYSTIGMREDKLKQELLVYIQNEDTLHLPGSVFFRFPDYREELNACIDYAVDEYMIEHQYQEFMTLLKYFVEVQESKIPIAHLIHLQNYDFLLLDEQFQPIKTDKIDKFVMEMIDQDLNYEDTIVSTLITVSPQKLYIHTLEPEMQAIKTLQKIFQQRSVIRTDLQFIEQFRQAVRNKTKLKGNMNENGEIFLN
ncbi:putative sporulation protein YtxC [Longirhabdus pacifica]|uniref:putative sporulation protein YtxC n=1 Tax=Longirhabdus pacifica TaxID=2305227 RepID=UPI0013E8CEC1|nr:putative sporulation protein YtxC [Longirhabdus pacifica]